MVPCDAAAPDAERYTMPPKTPPRHLDELYDVGGPKAYIEAVERRAGDEEARWWLNVLENRLLSGMDALTIGGFADTVPATFVVETWIRELRRRLRLKTPPDAVRALTRERVRRLRARRAAEHER
jgi:hypothetical protein